MKFLLFLLLPLFLFSCGDSEVSTHTSEREQELIRQIEKLKEQTTCGFDGVTYVCDDGTILNFETVINQSIQQINQDSTCNASGNVLSCSNGFTIDLTPYLTQLSCTLTNGSIVCPDGTSTVIPSCTVSKDEAAGESTVTCTDGTSVVISDGQDGADGQNGQDGEDGADGSDGKDGQDGKDGEDAEQSPYAIVDILDPCGKETSFDEILLVLANGDILAHYSDGEKQHFTKIFNGTYRTTDGTGCVFRVNDGVVTW